MRTGNLLLDETGEMPLLAQAKLLRVLETREVRPLGSPRSQQVDVRVVAATNQGLEEMVAARRFRADLFYRLNVARLELPPLRERLEDLPILLDTAIAELNARDGARVSASDPEMMACLLAHDWPGNVRELRNLVEAVFIDPPIVPIGLNHLPPAFRRIFESYRSEPSAERDRLVAALQETRRNKAEAARMLSWSRMTLYRKLAKYRIERMPQG